MRKATVHKFLEITPPVVGGGLVTVATLGGEDVRKQIWEAIVATASDPVWLSVILVVVLAWGLGWFLTREEGSPSSGHFTQTSSGNGSPNLAGTFNGPVNIHPPLPMRQERKQARANSTEAVTVAIGRRLDGEARFGAFRDVEPRPDLPLAGVLMRVYKKLGPAPTPGSAKRAAFNRKVDHEIADGVKFNRMHVWGRSGDGRPSEEIDLHTWEGGAFDHAKARFSWAPAYSDICYLTDLRFNKAEVDRVWPMPPKTSNDGRP